MADVKWIKVCCNLFDNRKIKQIECLPNGDTIIVIWVKLICLAGSINDKGLVYFTQSMPYTNEMLARQFGRPLKDIQDALSTFEQFGMIEMIDGRISISNWEKYQSVDRLQDIREYNRLAQQRSRARRKQNVNDKSMTGQRCHDTDIDIDREKDIYKRKPKNKFNDYKQNNYDFDNIESDLLANKEGTE